MVKLFNLGQSLINKNHLSIQKLNIKLSVEISPQTPSKMRRRSFQSYETTEKGNISGSKEGATE